MSDTPDPAPDGAEDRVSAPETPPEAEAPEHVVLLRDVGAVGVCGVVAVGPAAAALAAIESGAARAATPFEVELARPSIRNLEP